MNVFQKLITHPIAHLLGWNYGNVEAWWNNGKLMVGFRCKGCNKLIGVHESKVADMYFLRKNKNANPGASGENAS